MVYLDLGTTARMYMYNNSFEKHMLYGQKLALLKF